MVQYKTTDAHVEIYFDGRPSQNIIETLKVCNWRWSSAKRCWRAYKNLEAIKFAKDICTELNPKEKNPLLARRRQKLETQDLMVKSNVFSCEKNHFIEDVAGEIDILGKDGKVYTYLVPIGYCSDCNVYYILEDVFENIKTKGIVLHQVMNVLKYRRMGRYPFGEMEMWKEESPLKLWGYSVNTKDGYSDIQRQAILTLLVDKGIMTREKICSYLSFFIRMNSRLENAVQKWKDDKRYIEQYKLGSFRRIKIGEIRAVHYIDKH